MPELKNIFDRIRDDFTPLDALTSEDRERQGAIRERIARNPGETSMISQELGYWFQTDKINPLKVKLRDRFHEIAPTGDTRDIIRHFRASIVNRLQRLLPELNIQNSSLLGENLEHLAARQQLCQQISQNIHNREGDERERQIHAFELITALQALYPQDPRGGIYDNPLNMQLGETRYRQWLSYMYLASQFFELEDITFPKGERETDQAFKDRVFQFFVRAVSDVIRGHNVDHWPDDPYHPENAPSCEPGSIGRLLLGCSWHKDLTLFTPEPVFNDPTKAVDVAIVNQLLQDLANGSVKDSKKLLQSLDLIGQGEIVEYAYQAYFTWDDAKKAAIAERVANDLIQEWTQGLSDNDKREVTRRDKEAIKGLVLEKINYLLTYKYTTQYPPQGDFAINEGTVERFKAGALRKLFESDPDRVEEHFLEFYELSGIMRFYCKEKGCMAALELWRTLPAFNPSLTDPQPTTQYLQLLVDWVVAGNFDVSYLKNSEKALLREILLVDDKAERGMSQVSLRQNLLKNLNWEQLSAMLEEVLEENWKRKLINSPLCDYLLKTMLTHKQYSNFGKMCISLYGGNVARSGRVFISKFNEKVQEILSHEWKRGRVDLLTHLRMRRREIFDSPAYDNNIFRNTGNFLSNLPLPELQYLLDEGLKNNLEALDEIKNDLCEVHYGFPYAKQIEILAYLETAENLGEGSLAYINLIKSFNSEGVAEDRQRAIRRARECWNNIWIRARQSRDLDTCRMLWKTGGQEVIKQAVREAFQAVTDEEDLELKAQKREDLSFLLSFMAEQGVTEEWLRQLYRQAFVRYDSETCRLFLPLLKNFEYYPLLLSTQLFGFRYHYLPEGLGIREEYDFLSQIFYGAENKELLVSRLRGQVSICVGKLRALSHLMVSPLNQMKYTGDNEEVRGLHRWVQEELNKLVDPQINHLLAGNSPTLKQTKLSGITGDLVAKFIVYFANLPENPRAAFEEIIREAQESVNEKLGTEADCDLRSFLLNALLVLLTGGLALIPILINKACGEPDFFSDERTMPKDHLKKAFRGLNRAEGFFDRMRTAVVEEEAAPEPEENTVNSEELSQPSIGVK